MGSVGVLCRELAQRRLLVAVFAAIKEKEKLFD
jgi:hypothetical protein